jgi:F0F1-type ATP synthase membrane subunit c/vacuolar-type H+-ATPase subunit K
MAAMNVLGFPETLPFFGFVLGVVVALACVWLLT